jgi:hypothetical protein
MVQSEVMSRSTRLRKYESAYYICLKKIDTQKSNVKRSPKNQIKRSPKTSPTPRTRGRNSESKVEKPIPLKKKPLSDYQKFVQQESKKTEYSGMPAKKRMTEISKSWSNLKST